MGKWHVLKLWNVVILIPPFFRCNHEYYVQQRLYNHQGNRRLFQVLQCTSGIPTPDKCILSGPQGGHLWHPILHSTDIQGSVHHLRR